MAPKSTDYFERWRLSGAGFGGLSLRSESALRMLFMRRKDAGLSAELGAGRDIFFYGEFSGAQTGFAGNRNRFAKGFCAPGETLISL